MNTEAQTADADAPLLVSTINPNIFHKISFSLSFPHHTPPLSPATGRYSHVHVPPVETRSKAAGGGGGVLR